MTTVMEGNNTAFTAANLPGRNAKIFYQDTNHMQNGKNQYHLFLIAFSSKNINKCLFSQKDIVGLSSWKDKLFLKIQ